MHSIKELLDSFYHMVVQRLYLFRGGRPSCSPMFRGKSCPGVSAWPRFFESWRWFASHFYLVPKPTRKAVPAEFWVSSPTNPAATSAMPPSPLRTSLEVCRRL